MKHNLIEPIIGGPTPDHLIIAVDFDGTICQHPGQAFPAIGEPVPHALAVLKRIQEAGHKIIVWTMRSTTNGVQGDILWPAVDYMIRSGIGVWGYNDNPDQSWSSSPKVYAHMYIDDAALGCPLVRPDSCRAYVDWPAVEAYLEKIGVLDQKESQDFTITFTLDNDPNIRTCPVWEVDQVAAIQWLRERYDTWRVNILSINGDPYFEARIADKLIIGEGGVAA